VIDLLVLSGSQAGACFSLPDVPTIIGRSPEAHLRLDDAWISNLHALFERRGRALWVVDLNSLNGTFVGGQRVTEVCVTAGSVLAFGQTEVRLEPHGAAGLAEDAANTPIHYEAVSITARSNRVATAAVTQAGPQGETQPGGSRGDR
jgi:pSer/pThr/pTyr-binding forkhead associated (FHA) protein